MKIKKCRKIVDEIFAELEASALDEYFLTLTESVDAAKEACARIIKVNMEAGE